MANFGLVVTSPISSYKNIGDYMQSLAALQFLSEEYVFVEKEQISNFHADNNVKVIMNAWYMWHPENWPPPPCIQPLLTSIHVTPLKAKEMLTDEGKLYFKKHAPVGCRDLETKRILENNGIASYFSACLTLTLGWKYKNDGERHGAIFVDPFIPPYKYIVDGKSIFYPLNVLRSYWYYVHNFRKVNRLVKGYNYFKAKYFFLTIYKASMFYKAYSTMFEDDLIFSAEYLTHMVPVTKEDDNQSLLNKTEELLYKYAKANLVITSRIHCALPCTGIGTPVLFVINKDMESAENKFGSPGRYGGLIDFFRLVRYDKDRLTSTDKAICKFKKISKNSQIKIKENWKEYADKMIKQCVDFCMTEK